MDFLPLFHNLRGRTCLVIGGGEIALRKLRPLLEAGAKVKLVAPTINPGIRALEVEGAISIHEREFIAADVDDVALIIAATDHESVNQQVSALAQQRHIPVNVVDSPELCSVIFPSIIDRSPVQIAISTGGSAPVLARLLRGKIEALIPAGFGRLATLANRFRPRVKQAISSENQRRKFWEQVFEGRVAEAVFSGDELAAEGLLEAALANHKPVSQGEVYLVGGGPGDPDLLTFRALRLMQQADIVLYDRLVSKEVLNLVRRDAERIYVGKTAGDHPVTQENINSKLVEYARQGHRVLRLKGGDPFIFGRGGEEIEHLAEHGIAFQVVPGITAASGCASYAGIPLTHRDYAQSVRFITGHRKGDQLSLDWQQLAAPGQTLVFYMGLNSLPTISEQLVVQGMSPETPAALIEKGTTTHQRVVVGTLASLPRKVAEQGVRAPTLIIVGGVVLLRDKLNWFKGEVYD
jgi:uroporphyrin-III C-methyltransferase/precorrin-2 dehydrogenase/sirohydrochlorin ferrochelatase